MNEGDLILCTVEKVTNTITFVKMPNGEEGTIISSEIAPGRIKFMRQYVVPNKKVVCKVLKVEGKHAHLSLRRVSSKEKKEVMQKFKQDQAIRVAFNQILGDESEKIKKSILEDYPTLTDFIDAVRGDKKLISKYLPKDKKDSLLKITEKRRKSHEMSAKIHVKCLEEDGVKRIQKLLTLEDPSVQITYIAGGEFGLKLVVEDFKQGKKQMQDILEDLAKKAKKANCEFTFKE